MADFADKTDIQDKIQSLMNEVYNEWQKDENKGKSKWDVLDNFSEAHQIAVVFGNFNYQVENGGLYQWIYNGYFHDDAEKLTEYLESGVGLDERCQKILDIIYKLYQYARDTNCDREGYYIDPDDEDSESQFIGDMIDCDFFDTWYYEHCGKDDWWRTVGDIIEKVTGHEFVPIPAPAHQDEGKSYDIESSFTTNVNDTNAQEADAIQPSDNTSHAIGIAESAEPLTFKEFLDKHRGSAIDAITQGGYLYLTGEQTQNFESLSAVNSHLGVRGSDELRPLNDELLGGVVQVRGYYEKANEYAIIVDEIAGARLLAQERSKAEISGKDRSAGEPQQGDGDIGLEGYATDKETPLTHPFSVYIENTNNRNIGGFTIPLPTSPAEIRPFLDDAEIIDWRDMKLYGLEAPNGTEMRRLTNKINDILYGTEMTLHTLNELNYLAARIEKVAERGESGGIEIFIANIEASRNCESIAEIINLTFDDNLNKFDVLPVYDANAYGELLINQFRQDEHADAFNRLADSIDPNDKAFAVHIEMLEKHADYRSFGRAVAKEEGGVFTEQGYLLGGDEGLLEIYRTREDIPQEYIIQQEYPDELRFLTKHIPPDADRAEIEYLAIKIQSMDAEQMKVFGAVIEAGLYCGSVAEIINTTENLDCFNLRPISDEEEYGMKRLEQDADDASTALDRLEKSTDPNDRALIKHIKLLNRAVEDEAYGRYAALDENAIFTKQGMLFVDSEPKAIYRGVIDLPNIRKEQTPEQLEQSERTADKLSPDDKPSVIAQIAEHRKAQRSEPPKDLQTKEVPTISKKKTDPEL